MLTSGVHKNNTENVIPTLIGLFFTIITISRLFPLMWDFGYDFIPTQEQFPGEISSGFGLWYWLAQALAFIGTGFPMFWIIISCLFGYSVYLFTHTTYKNPDYKKSWLLNIILFIMLMGYFLPWFAFAHVRYGTAVFIALAGLNEESKIKRIILLALASSVHMLLILYIAIFYCIKIKAVQKYFFLFLAIGLAIIFAFKNIILVSLLGLISYSNYTNDLVEYNFGAANLIMIFRATIIFVAIFILVPKKQLDRILLLFICTTYVLLAILSPFSGRFIEMLYPNLLPKIKFVNVAVIFCILFLVVVEAFFSIARVIFHYEI